MLYLKQQAGDSGSFASTSLPHSAAIPDMTATTEYFVRLQQIYQEQAAAEMKAFKAILCELLQVSGGALSRCSEHVNMNIQHIHETSLP